MSEKSEKAVFLFPWHDLTQAALAVLHWPPASMWAATPREIMLALGRPDGEARSAGPSRRDLTGLMHRYPDKLKR